MDPGQPAPPLIRSIGPLALSALFASLCIVAARQDVYGDFAQHAGFSERMAGGAETPSHFLYHLLIVLVHAATSLSPLLSGYIVIWVAAAVAFLLSYRFLSRGITTLPRASFALACLALFLYHPLPIAYPFDRHLYFGYVSANVYHNPTILLLRPLALLHFVYLTRLMGRDRVSGRQLLLLGSLTVLSLLAKPSYLLSLAPALLVIWLAARSRRGLPRRVNSQVVFLSTLAPAAALLAAQFAHTYMSRDGAGVGITPLALFTLRSPLSTLVPKLAASLAFPLIVILFFPGRLKDRTDFRVAALNLIFSLIYNYGLVENGDRFAHGNFTWSSQIALFLLVMVCMRALLEAMGRVRLGETPAPRERLGLRLSMVALTAHSLAGVLWFLSNVRDGAFRP